MSVTNEVRADDFLVSVGQNALQGTSSGFLDGLLDVVEGGRVLQASSQVDARDVNGRDTEGHTSQLAVHVGDDLTDSLGGTGGGGDDVDGSSTTTTPVLLGRTVDNGLCGSGRVHGGHQTFFDAKLVVDNLDQRSQAVSGARSVGDNLLVVGIFLL